MPNNPASLPDGVMPGRRRRHMLLARCCETDGIKERARAASTPAKDLTAANGERANAGVNAGRRSQWDRAVMAGPFPRPLTVPEPVR